MFGSCLIKQVIKLANLKNQDLSIVQRHLAINYNIIVSVKTLKKRRLWMKISNQL